MAILEEKARQWTERHKGNMICALSECPAVFVVESGSPQRETDPRAGESVRRWHADSGGMPKDQPAVGKEDKTVVLRLV